MAYVITEPCVGVKDKGCVTVCPCDCIREGVIDREGEVYDMLFIDPDDCIDCGLDLGFNFFDTANVYGWKKGEGVTKLFGARCWQQGGGGGEKVVIATKV